MVWRRLGLLGLPAALWLLAIGAYAQGQLTTTPDAAIPAESAGAGGSDAPAASDETGAGDDPSAGQPSSEQEEEAGDSFAERNRGDDLTIYVLTMGPGDHPFFKFGHNAVWIADSKTGRNRVYNYGSFRFGSGSIFLRFWLGRFKYYLGRSNIRATLGSYRRRNRSVAAQELNLTPDQRLRLYDFLRWNAKRANRYYQYDYYRDNCSTRVRDAIDRVIGGRIRAAGQGPGSMTYRDHTLRLTADLLPEYVALHVVMGSLIDQPINEWEEAFLPERLQQLLRKVTVLRDGAEVPLVISEKVLVKTDRPPPLSQPPAWLPYFLTAGVAVGGGLAWAGRAGRMRRWLRILTSAMIALVGLLYGLLGTGFVLLWLLTDHEVAYGNENTLHCAPWLLALPVFAVGMARRGPRADRIAYWLLAAAAGLSTVGVVLKALPWFDQHNGQIIAFTLPTVVGMALAARWLSSARRDAEAKPPDR